MREDIVLHRGGENSYCVGIMINKIVRCSLARVYFYGTRHVHNIALIYVYYIRK